MKKKNQNIAKVAIAFKVLILFIFLIPFFFPFHLNITFIISRETGYNLTIDKMLIFLLKFMFGIFICTKQACTPVTLYIYFVCFTPTDQHSMLTSGQNCCF